MKVLTWARGLWQLRDPLLIRDLGERRFHLAVLANIQQKFPKAKLHPDIILISYQEDYLLLSESVTVSQGSILAFGDEMNGYGTISIGAHTWIGQYNNLRAGGGHIQIGCHCLISQFCTLVATNHSCRRNEPIRGQGADSGRCGVVLEDDVWLGAGVSVLPGVRIARGAVIGANAVVNRDVPEYEIWGGVPARKIGERN